MINAILGAFCACIASLGGLYAVMQFTSKSASHQQEKPAQIETAKTRMISVPIVSENVIRGYVIARFEFAMDAGLGKASGVPVESFVADQAFKVIYSYAAHDFKAVQKHDVAAISGRIIEGVNKRMGGDVVKHLLVDSWMFLNKKDVKTDGTRDD